MRKHRQLIDVIEVERSSDDTYRLSIEELRQLVPALKERGTYRLMRELTKEDDA